jgi:CBS domain-containing protein
MPMLDIVAAACSKVLELVREQPATRAEGGLTLTRERPVTVGSLMTSPAITCNPETTLAEVAQLMWNHDVGFLPVVARGTGELIGVITDRDALMGAWTQGKPLWEVPASVPMHTNPKTCRPEMPIEEAEEALAAYQVYRLPVVDAQGRLVGVLSLRDVARKAAVGRTGTIQRDVAVVLGSIGAPRALRALPPSTMH